ncbi:MAG: CPBP family intramembrane glutamic endopeptidase [Polyangia bacterium]
MGQPATRLWRFLQSPVTRLVIGLVVVIGATIAVQAAAQALHLPPALGALAAIAAVVGSYVAFVRLIERRPVVELGRARAAGEVGRGMALGAALFAGTIVVLSLLRVCHLERGDGWRALVPALVMSLAAAFSEEILVRGLLFRIVEESLGSWIAVVLSAGLFGVLHAFNHGATIVSTLSIAFEAGVLLAAAYVYSRRLWLPIGLHLGWNFTEGGIFGAAVSGHPGHGLWRSHFAGAELLTGGEFGPEASVVAVVLCFAVALLLLARARKRGHVVAPFWQRPTR